MLREAGAPLTGDVLLVLAVFPDEAPDPRRALEASPAACSLRPNPFGAGQLRNTSPLWRRAPLAVSSTGGLGAGAAHAFCAAGAATIYPPPFARIAVFFPPVRAIDASDPFARVTLVLPEGARRLSAISPVQQSFFTRARRF